MPKKPPKPDRKPLGIDNTRKRTPEEKANSLGGDGYKCGGKVKKMKKGSKVKKKKKC